MRGGTIDRITFRKQTLLAGGFPPDQTFSGCQRGNGWDIPGAAVCTINNQCGTTVMIL